MILEIRDGNNTAGDLIDRSGLKKKDLAKKLNSNERTIFEWRRNKTDVCLGVYFELVNYLNSVGKLFLEGEFTGYSLDTESKSLNNVRELFDINMVSKSSYAKYVKASTDSIYNFCSRNEDPLNTKVSRYISVFLFTSARRVLKNDDFTINDKENDDSIIDSRDVNSFRIKMLHDKIKGRRIKDINNNPYIKGTPANLKMMSRQGW